MIRRLRALGRVLEFARYDPATAFVRRKPRSQAMSDWLRNQARTVALNARCTPRGAVHVDANIRRRALGRGCGGVVDCPLDLQVGPWPAIVAKECRFRPYTRAGDDDGLQIEFKPAERKTTSTMGVDN